MNLLTTRARIGPDGILNVQIPTQWKDSEVEIVVVIQPISPTKDIQTWPDRFFEETYGAFQATPLQRENQGSYPEREKLI